MSKSEVLTSKRVPVKYCTRGQITLKNVPGISMHRVSHCMSMFVWYSNRFKCLSFSSWAKICDHIKQRIKTNDIKLSPTLLNPTFLYPFSKWHIVAHRSEAWFFTGNIDFSLTPRTGWLMRNVRHVRVCISDSSLPRYNASRLTINRVLEQVRLWYPPQESRPHLPIFLHSPASLFDEPQPTPSLESRS